MHLSNRQILFDQVKRNRVLSVALTVIVVTALTSVFPRPEEAKAPFTLSAEEQSFLSLINDYRSQNGIAPLQLSFPLMSSARWMSADMAQVGYFSHTDSTGKDTFTRLARFGYSYNTWMGENIAAGYPDALNTFNQWKASPGHNQNMLNANYKAIGIGRVANPSSAYQYYWTTDFGGVPDYGP